MTLSSTVRMPVMDSTIAGIEHSEVQRVLVVAPGLLALTHAILGLGESLLRLASLSAYSAWLSTFILAGFRSAGEFLITLCRSS